MTDPELLEHHRLLTEDVFHVDRDRVRMPNGREVTVSVVRHPVSVVILPVPEPGQLILVNQYRYAVNRWMWECPAGSVDPGEKVETAARRECAEEIGLAPETVIRLGSLFPTPGYCDEEMVFFRLSGLSEPAEPAAKDDDEDIRVGVFSIKTVRDMIRRGEIVDMKTIAGMSFL
jgi:ADP-ribose pyrophosphatase